MNEPNWQQRITDLEASGHKLAALAKRVGLSVQALSDIKNGRTTEPKGMAAVRLHDLHTKAMRKRAA